MIRKSCACLLFVFTIHTVTGDIACIRKGGKCQENSIRCDNYYSGLCNGGRTRQCCVSNSVADRPCVAKGGKCQQNTQTCSGDYQRGLCGGSSARQCCVPRSGSKSCSAAATALACKIKNSSKISLLKTNPSGVNDGADPNSNIRDACAGKKVKRSSYKCSEGQAPGGTTCLDAKILQYIYDLGTSTKYKVQVNAIAGACHSTTSKHYDGKAVDFQKFGSATEKAAQEKAFRDACTKHGGWSHGGTHVHCQIAIIHTVTGDTKCVRKGGKCQHILNRCNEYQRGLCNGGWTRQCCINNPGDTACIRKGGKCQHISNRCNKYQRGLCSGRWTRQCCFNTASTSCSAAVKSVACKIKSLSKISLLRTNPSGVSDGADPYRNIRDACAGRRVKRSSYTCSQGQAPGGTTCLDLKVLQYIYYLGTNSKYRVQVNAIAGACHSRRSKHYAGKAVDLQLFGNKATRRAQEKAFRAACTKRGGWSHGGTHVHCQIV